MKKKKNMDGENEGLSTVMMMMLTTTQGDDDDHVALCVSA